MGTVRFPWADGPYLAIDTETTGVSPFADRVVEVAVVQVNTDATTVDPFTTIVNPGIDIPDEAAAIHGITTDRARTEGLPTAAAIEVVAERVAQAIVNGWPVVMFNARFDWPMILSEAERHDLDFPAFAGIIDPYLLDKMLDRYRSGGRQLVKVAGHYGITLNEADLHGALPDATAAAAVLRALVDTFPVIAHRSLGSMFMRQARGHEIWRESFIDYKRRRDDPQFTMPHGWPIPAGPLPAPLAPAEPTQEPATAEDVPAEPPPALPDDGKEVAAAGEPATSDPDTVPAPGPDDRTNSVSVRDVGIYAGRIFKADGEAAPPRQKTKTIDRLRHALVWACTDGRCTSLNDVTPQELIGIYQWLHHIGDRKVTYAHDGEGVIFTLTAKGTERRVLWTDVDLETAGAAA